MATNKKAPAKKKTAKKRPTKKKATGKRGEAIQELKTKPPPRGRRSRAKDAPPPLDRGRPSDFDDSYNEQAYRLCLLMNATDADLADYFGVHEKTINNWKKTKEGFADALKQGKLLADAKVAASLHDRATGFTRDGTYYPPDTAAARYWLGNRQSDIWRERTTRELSGPDGGAIPVATANLDVADKDAAEAAKVYKEFLDATGD